MSKEIAKTTGGHQIADNPAYRQFIEDLKTRVVSARISAARAVNRELILLYWDIGRGIVEKQRFLCRRYRAVQHRPFGPSCRLSSDFGLILSI